jgi:tripartite ATP-independent transporter DctP family solute receptor
MKLRGLSRRRFAAGMGAAAAAALMPTRRAKAAPIVLRQFHNQAPDSPLQRRLVQMWAAVETETGGKVHVNVFPENDHVQGSDPKAFQMLRSGELDFFTLMGGLIADAVPVADIQGIPFSFRKREQVYAAIDGDVGRLIHDECLAKGIYLVPGGGFENGFRQITSRDTPVRTAADLKGMKFRIPAGEMFRDLFSTLGARPIVVNSIDIHQALKEGRVDAQENPLFLVSSFKLYDYQHYVSLTSHMWSGFNLIANLDKWRSLPEDVRASVERNAPKFVKLQRDDNTRANDAMTEGLKQKGMTIVQPDLASFRAPLGDFYARWKTRVGSKAWALLEGHVGKLG